MDMEFLTRGLDVAHSGFVGTVASSARYSVVELVAPVGRDIFVTSVTIYSGVNAYIEKGSSTFVTTGLVTHPLDSRSNFSKLIAGGVGCSGSSSTAPNLTGFLVPASLVTEKFPVPMLVKAGEHLAMISESQTAAVKYGFKWLELDL